MDLNSFFLYISHQLNILPHLVQRLGILFENHRKRMNVYIFLIHQLAYQHCLSSHNTPPFVRVSSYYILLHLHKDFSLRRGDQILYEIILSTTLRSESDSLLYTILVARLVALAKSSSSAFIRRSIESFLSLRDFSLLRIVARFEYR